MMRPSLLHALLAADEPAPVQRCGTAGASPFLFTCDHAGCRLPAVLGTLGLSPSALESHIAWDIGAAEVARRLAAQLGAELYLQTYSRLVIDCNRPLGTPDSIAVSSERTPIPGNQDLSAAEAERRAHDIFEPYHARIRSELDRREAQGCRTILVAMHSFTPSFLDVGRPWHVGLICRDRRLAEPLLHELRRASDLVVGDNEPYSMADATDFTLIEHGERRGILHVGVEVRQDLIAEEAGQSAWAQRLAQAIEQASASCLS